MQLFDLKIGCIWL